MNPQGSLSDVHLSWDGKQFVVDIDSEQDGKKDALARSLLRHHSDIV